jgi:hypothetical protein
LRKENSYLLSQIGNANETQVYFGILSKYTVYDTGAKCVVIKTLGYEKMCVTVTLAVLADGSKLPPCVFLNRKTMPKEQLSLGIIGRCQPKDLMTSEIMKD